jgi:hypothetical protein
VDGRGGGVARGPCGRRAGAGFDLASPAPGPAVAGWLSPPCTGSWTLDRFDLAGADDAVRLRCTCEAEAPGARAVTLASREVVMSWLMLVSLAEAKKPKGPPPAPPVGWAREEGWMGDCYYPPDWAKLGEGDRRMARQTTLEQMKAQWLGQREDNLKFDANVVDDVETVLLGRPKMIEVIAAENFNQCKQQMTRGGDAGGWQSWLSALPSRLTAGECLQPLSYTLFDYLDINSGWQRPVGLCKGDRAHILTTVKDRYKLSKEAAWITSEGNGEKAVAAEYPCNIEGCFVGMVVGKFEGDSGVVTVFPIGAETVFTAPENGTVYWCVNDTELSDNRYFKSATIEDKTAMTIEPAQ